ncbi:MAG: efflux RND transporter periplasmic adaptor subunit [Sphaerochaetaceae bacterium]|nr:efflux RND transporter periplasmic adaptor subunit [Sphaerochaetaceae bacterium]
MENKNAEEKLLINRKKIEKKKKRRRNIIIAIILIAVIFFTYSYNFHIKNGRWPWVSAESTASNSMMGNVQQVTATVYEKTNTPVVEISGYVEAYDTQDVMLRSSGTVTAVYVEEGDRVEKGQLLVTLDNTSQNYDVASARLQLEKAELNGTSERELELYRMRLKTAEKQLENTAAYALFDGVVVSVNAKTDDYFQAGTAIMKIIDDSKYKSTVEVDEIDVQSLEEGMKAVLTSDSAPGVQYEGYVSYIPMIGRYSNQGIGVMDVEIVVENPPAGLKPGFSFEGTINTGLEQTMLLVPQSAVTENRGVYTVNKLNADGSTETVTVQVKYLGENVYQILSGDIKSGDTVVYSTTNSLASLMRSMSSPGGRR